MIRSFVRSDDHGLNSRDEAIRLLLQRWRDDSGGTYRTWFLWDERLKNFRSIRRGIAAVVDEIERGAFGNVYQGSSLETVVHSVAEQRQIFRGADHAFLWKPKLRIPDIYEDRENQIAFGRFLDTCACCTTEPQLVEAIRALDRRQIKGLGPAAANLLYFLHPTIAPPSNTALVKGYNELTGAMVKLGRWEEYLAMRRGILDLNSRYRDLLSNDLGALAGFLFDLGKGRYQAPPLGGDDDAFVAWKQDLAAVRAEAALAAKALVEAEAGDRSHTEVQGWLRDLGRALGFAVWIARNDRNRSLGDGRLGDGCVDALPGWIRDGASAETVSMIDVLWLDERAEKVVAAFEVEHTTSIYSGIVRMLDLALGLPDAAGAKLFLVAPDSREEQVRTQLTRPAFRSVADLKVQFLPYSELEKNRGAMARFGSGLRPIESVARQLA
jgi:type II restriction enzyme